MLKWRIISAVVGLPLLVVALWQGGVALLLVTVLLALLGGHEWWNLTVGRSPLRNTGLARGIFFVGLLIMVILSGTILGAGPDPRTVGGATAALGWVGLVPGLGSLMYALLWTMATLYQGDRQPEGRTGGRWAGGSAGPLAGPLPVIGMVTAGWLYVGFTFAHWPALRHLGDGLPGAVWPSGPILWTVALVWAGDTAAYLIGTRWGRRPLAPRLSPNKSVEGAAAGLAVAVLVAVLLRHWPGREALTAGVIGGIVGLFGQVGDLWESALKRGAGVKDSGGLIPGHGGVLDRFDGLLLALPISYYLLTWLPF